MKLYGKFTTQDHDWFYVGIMPVLLLLGFLLGVLALLDAFDLSPLKKEKSEAYTIIDGDLEHSFLYPTPPDADFSNIFRTKLGLCYVIKDRIIMVTEAAEIDSKKEVVEKSVWPFLTIHTTIGLVFVGFSIYSFLHDAILASFMFGGLGVYLVIKIILSINNFATPIIPRDRILEFKYKKAIPFLTRDYFSIVFLDKYGRTKKRLIILPGIIQDGSSEANKALQIMKSENYM